MCADPFAALEGLDHPSTAAQAQQAPAGPGIDMDALYAAPAPQAQQQQGSFLWGRESFAAPAAQQPSLMGDPFAAPSPGAGLSGISAEIWLLPVFHS